MSNQAPPNYQMPSSGNYGPQAQQGWGDQGQHQQNNPFEGPHDYENQGYNDGYTEKPQGGETFDQAFKVDKPKWNDWPFTLFFIAVCAGFVAVAGITLRAMAQTKLFQGDGIYDSGNNFTMNNNTSILFGFVVVLGVVGLFAIILYARFFPKIFITTGLIMNIIMGLATSIYYFTRRYWSAAVVFLVFTLITAWCYWLARRRIPFSATVLTIAIDVMKRYPSTFITALLGLIITGAFGAFFSLVVVATYMRFEPNANNPACDLNGGGCSQAKLIGVLVFVFFAGYYITEVIRNIMHVTISGIFGTWYYLDRSDQGAPKHPGLGAFKRAMTYCFGLICFGSLIVLIIQLIRQGIQILKNNAFADGNYCEGCGMLILDFIIGFIDWAVRYFNHYAYCYIALYGKSYIRSAKDTFDLLRFKGMDALINDCFINTSLNMWSTFMAYLVALLCYLYLRYTAPAYNSDGSYYAPVVAFGFLISMQISRVALTVIDSGVSTFFVSLAKDPEVFQMTNRDKFDEVLRNYPQVLNKIMTDH